MTDKCAIMTVSDNVPGWKTADCSEEHHVVCETSIAPLCILTVMK